MQIVRTQPGGEGGSGHSYKLYYRTGGVKKAKEGQKLAYVLYTQPLIAIAAFSPHKCTFCRSFPTMG